jgi:starch synthase
VDVNILVATSEVVPFSKTGGLADVCGTLPRELARLGHQVTVVAPAYRQSIECGQSNESLHVDLDITIGRKQVRGGILRSQLPESDVTVYLIEQDDYYDRPQLYREGNEDYKDNCERFIFFSRSVLELIRLLKLDVDVLHCNDWQTGLIPAYLKIEYADTARFNSMATVMTIHNMAYQGQFWHWDMLLTGLDWKYFNWNQMEFFGKLNLLKTGLVFSDAINTVSPRYALEIQSPPLGCGLEGVLAHRSYLVRGILNGVDYSVWDPAVDSHIALNYTSDNWHAGKQACKQDLGEATGLPVSPETPLVGVVGRLVEQKGVDLIGEVLKKRLVDSNVQWVILGRGDQKYQDMFLRLAAAYPEKLSVRLEFSDLLAHQIEAGADLFLMPSSYEPCGLNQIYSLKYGTVPLVRETGGLADTIVDTNEKTLAAGTANGFSFRPYQVEKLDQTLERALQTYARKEDWDRVVLAGMKQDWSWTRSAKEYVWMYQESIARVRRTIHSESLT